MRNPKSRLFPVLGSLVLGYTIRYAENQVFPRAATVRHLGALRKSGEAAAAVAGIAMAVPSMAPTTAQPTTGKSTAQPTTGTAQPTTGQPTTGQPTTSQPTATATATTITIAPTLNAEQQKQAEAQACLDFPASMKEFRANLKDNVETQTFPQWTKRTTTPQHDHDRDHIWAFPKFNKELLAKAFGNRTFGFIGDSTSFYTERWLYKTLHLANQAGEDLDELTDTFATKYTRAYRVLSGATSDMGDNEHFQTIVQNNRVNIYWRGMRGGNGNPCNIHTQSFQWDWQFKQRPDILVAHYGLHLLHSGTATPKDGLNLCRAHQFVHYEEDFLERVLKLALEAGTKLLLFKTNNLMCFDKWMGRGGLDPFLKNDPAFFSECRDDLQRKLNVNNPTNVTLTTADMDLYCKEAAFTDKALQYLNAKTLAFVEKAKARLPPDSPLVIDVFNDRDIMSCQYTQMGDGFHYAPLQMPRIRMLAHQINCQYK